MSQVNIGPRSFQVIYLGLYSGIEFPETGYESGDWVLYNTLACGKVVNSSSHWCEIFTYRNGYGDESIATYFMYEGQTNPWNWHTLDRSRYIREYSEGPLIFFQIDRSVVSGSNGQWAAYVYDFTGGYWEKLREEWIPGLSESDIRANFEFIPLKAGISWPGLPRIDWTGTQRRGADGWQYWTPPSVPETTFDTSNIYDYGIITEFYRWYAGGNNPPGTDDPVEMKRIMPEYVKPTEPEKIEIIRKGFTQGPSGPIPIPISPEDKIEIIENPRYKK